MAEKIEDINITERVTPSLVVERLNPEVSGKERQALLRQEKITQYLGFYGNHGAEVLPILEDLI